MTAQDVINDARANLGDTIYPYQWLDSMFYTPINDAVRAIATAFPHSLYVSSVTTDLPADITATTDDVLIIDAFRNRLVELVVAQLISEDKQLQQQAIARTQGSSSP